MTISAQLETRIARSVAAVYAELTALERYPEWLVASGIVDVQRIVGEPIAPGARIRVQQQVAGRSATLDGVITVVEPDRLFGFEARDRDGVRVDIEAASWRLARQHFWRIEAQQGKRTVRSWLHDAPTWPEDEHIEDARAAAGERSWPRNTPSSSSRRFERE